MKKIFQYIMLAVVTIVMASCTSDIEETTAATGKSKVQLVVGEFPAFGDSQTRAIGTPDEGKTSWAEGDELLLVIDNTFYGKQYATFTYNGKSWELPVWFGFMVGRDVKTVNKKCLFAVVIVLVSLICLSACGALRDTADKNKALNESLPYYELNAANYDEISYNGLTYTITDKCLEMSELQEEIGQVSKRFKNVAGEDFSFGYVYSIVDVDISNAVAVNINNEYRKADIKNNDE